MPTVSELLTKAQERLTAAQERLTAALADGSDTTKPRELVTLAQAEVARLETEHGAELAAAEAEQAASLAGLAQAMVDGAHHDIAAEVDSLLNVPVPEVGTIPVNAAMQLCQARAKADEQQAAVTAHADRLAALRARLADLERQRQGIIERRAEGVTKPNDGAELALLVADHEGLAGLIQRAEQEVPTVDTRPVADWFAIHQRAVRDARVAALSQTADRLAIALAETLGRLPHQGRTWPMPAALSVALRGVS